MGNCPTALRRGIRFDEFEKVRKILDDAGSEANLVINEDHAPDCILGSCSRSVGNAFYFAVSYNRLNMVELMIEKGGDVYSQGVFGETCLHCAARRNNLNMVKLLLKHGCDVTTTDDMGRHTIHAAAQSYYDSSTMISFLVSEVGKSDDVNITDFNERTPLHDATTVNNTLVMTTLLDMGADINAQTKTGYTALHMCKDRVELWDLLISRGADTSITNSHGVPPKKPEPSLMRTR